MQFLAPTFAGVIAKHAIPPGGQNPPSLYNAHDAIYAAAAYLCDNGARDGTNLNAALWTYNHSRPTSTRSWPKPISTTGPPWPRNPPARTAPTPAAPNQNQTNSNAGSSETVQTVLGFTHDQIGSKYVWGGNGAADGGFDCSGLTTAAYAAAGITLPRTAQTNTTPDPDSHPAPPPNPATSSSSAPTPTTSPTSESPPHPPP